MDCTVERGLGEAERAERRRVKAPAPFAPFWL